MPKRMKESDFTVISKERLDALITVTRYACFDDPNEFEDFIDQCEHREVDPHDEAPKSMHVYAIGLRALDEPFHCGDSKCPRCNSQE